jgi:hypothetical protein
LSETARDIRISFLGPTDDFLFPHETYLFHSRPIRGMRYFNPVGPPGVEITEYPHLSPDFQVIERVG